MGRHGTGTRPGRRTVDEIVRLGAVLADRPELWHDWSARRPSDTCGFPLCQADVLDWHAMDWRACEDHVRRLRQRIVTASQAQDHKRVRNLQVARWCRAT